MGLITKKINIVLNNVIIKHYEDLGYFIPRIKDNEGRLRVKRGTSICVDVRELTAGSNVTIECECDNCKKNIYMKYYKYIKNNHNGKIYCKNCANKILNSKENHWNWNNNKTEEERILHRDGTEYKEFNKKVMARDKYKCVICGNKATDVHHLYGYSNFPEYRTDVSQACACCKKCHKSFHSWQVSNFGYENRGACTREQFEKWSNLILSTELYNDNLITARKIICLETKEINEASYFSILNNTEDIHIYNCCNKKSKSVKGNHYLWYDEYKNMSKYDIDEYLIWTRHNNSKNIICMNNLEIFNCITDALNKYKIHSPASITKSCKDNTKSGGKNPITGEKLYWMYYEDYIEQKLKTE